MSLEYFNLLIFIGLYCFVFLEFQNLMIKFKSAFIILKHLVE
ncbi:hypothetical protein BC751_1369 [Cecembia calidifontis]|uniref:Uncharacterized protein n=1 Tax=Cecembia calidifontis TaxID=1187080 RepID=A0A4Q7P714_9BACT|nr:hypothetical protein BC751_1369 [Cecembia calidifontis]